MLEMNLTFFMVTELKNKNSKLPLYLGEEDQVIM